MERKPKLKKAPPHEFVLEALSGLAVETRPMFGCLAVYVEERMVLILRDKRDERGADGVWICTRAVDNEDNLRREFPNLRPVILNGKQFNGWQLLSVDADDFESAALKACELIAKRDPRIGKIPERRPRKKSLPG